MNEPDEGVLDQCGSRFTVSEHDVDNAGRKDVEQRAESCHGKRGLLARLHHDRVSCHEHAGEKVGDLAYRVVPRRDQRGDAIRPVRHVTRPTRGGGEEVACGLGCRSEHLDRALDVLLGHDHRLPHLA